VTADASAPADSAAAKTAAEKEKARRERRRFPRSGVKVDGQLLRGVTKVDCTVLEVSPGGALLSVAEKLPTLGPATLRIPGAGAFHCRIAWSRDGRAGICFLHDVDWNAERLAKLVSPD
jgi:hypothetical protein